MSTWLSITVIAGAQVISQLICVTGAICQERARARAVCIQLEAAASSGIILVGQHRDGSSLLIVPGRPAQGQALTAELASSAFGEKSPL